MHKLEWIMQVWRRLWTKKQLVKKVAEAETAASISDSTKVYRWIWSVFERTIRESNTEDSIQLCKLEIIVIQRTVQQMERALSSNCQLQLYNRCSSGKWRMENRQKLMEYKLNFFKMEGQKWKKNADCVIMYGKKERYSDDWVPGQMEL